MNHTRTPWRLGRPGTVVADEAIPEMGGADDVAYYGGHMVAESIAPRNAEFIVRACNAHDDLLAALQEVFVIGEKLVSDVYGYEFKEKALAAIAKATAQ